MERVSLKQAKSDIEEAFHQWGRWDPDEPARSHARVAAFLAQCEADDRQREAALNACIALLEWHADKANQPIGDALKLAKMATEPWPVIPTT